MHRADFAYDLPEDLIAQTPLAERSASRLLALDGNTGAISDLTLRDLPGLVRPGDLLVFNDTRVVAARLVGFKPSGGRVEIFLERALDERHALVQLRASKAIREELEIATEGGPVRVVEKADDLWKVALPAPVVEFFERWGEVPLPPYIHRTPGALDRERYQSIFAEHAGAVAAPTASLHFDVGLVEALDARGVRRAMVTLHVGAGTFQPVRVDDLASHVMHAEWISVGAATCRAIAETRAAGGRVIAIGTTVARALEAAALAAHARRGEGASLQSSARWAPAEDGGAKSREPQVSGSGGEKNGVPEVAGSQGEENGTPEVLGSLGEKNGAGAVGERATASVAAELSRSVIEPFTGDTRLFITPGFQFRVVDALLTNFHLPESTLLMLVSAFAGREKVLSAYRHAVQLRYRFFSYGDAMFVTPEDTARNTDR